VTAFPDQRQDGVRSDRQELVIQLSQQRP